VNWCLELSSLSYSDDGGSVDGERDRANALSIVAFPPRPGPFVVVAPPPGTLLSRFESVATSRGFLALDLDREKRIRLDRFGCGVAVCDRDCRHRYWVNCGFCLGHEFLRPGFLRPSPLSGGTNHSRSFQAKTHGNLRQNSRRRSAPKSHVTPVYPYLFKYILRPASVCFRAI